MCPGQRELPWELIFNSRTGGLSSGQKGQAVEGREKRNSKQKEIMREFPEIGQKLVD